MTERNQKVWLDPSEWRCTSDKCTKRDTCARRLAPIAQGLHLLTVALCRDCHMGSFNGLHGQRRVWAAKKMTELHALVVTLARLLGREYA